MSQSYFMDEILAKVQEPVRSFVTSIESKARPHRGIGGDLISTRGSILLTPHLCGIGISAAEIDQ